MNWRTCAFAVGLVALLCLVAAIALVIDLRRTRATVGSLEAELIAAQEVEQLNGGGLETDPPPIHSSEALYRFPIAETDYLRLTSPFGYRLSPLVEIERYHQGVDIAATWKAQVVAVADGVVVEHWPPPDGYYKGHPLYGGLVVVEHEGGWRSLYAHLSWTRVHQGFRVTAGEVIGRVGNTGQSDGAHLHFEILDPEGTPENPLLYVDMPPGKW